MAIQLPAVLLFAQSFPDGPGKDTFEFVCGFCHPPSFVLDQSFTKAEWQNKVAAMLQQENVSQQEKDAIVAYLARNFPKRVKINQAPVQELQTILEITETQASALVAASRQSGSALKSIDDLKNYPGFTEAKIDEVRNRILF